MPSVSLGRSLLAVVLPALVVTGTLGQMPARAAGADRSAAATRAAAERDFVRSIRVRQTANDLTADIARHVGNRVNFVCKVDAIVRGDTLIGQCGRDVEPVDLYVRMPTKGRRVGDEFRLLGIVQTPATWVDALGHQTLYPIVRAVFIDPTNVPQ